MLIGRFTGSLRSLAALADEGSVSGALIVAEVKVGGNGADSFDCWSCGGLGFWHCLILQPGQGARHWR